MRQPILCSNCLLNSGFCNIIFAMKTIISLPAVLAALLLAGCAACKCGCDCGCSAEKACACKSCKCSSSSK